MKLYVHYEGGRGGSPSTIIIDVLRNATIKTLLAAFVLKHADKTTSTTSLLPEKLVVSSSRKKNIRLTKLVSREFQDRSDVIIHDSNDMVKNTSASKPAYNAKAMLLEALTLRKKHRIKQSRTILEKLQKHDPYNRTAFIQLGEMALYNEQWERAKTVLSSGVSAYPKDRILSIRLGDAFFGSFNFRKAHELFLRAAQMKVTEVNDSTTSANKIEKDLFGTDQASILVKIGKCLYHLGQQDTGIALYQKVLSEQENHCAALLAYARAAFDRGKIEGAIQIVLRVLVKDQKNVECRSLFSELVQWKANGEPKAGLQALYSQFEDNSSQLAPAFAFMATILKDYSAIDESVELYTKALDASPNSVCYTLNLVHTMELYGNSPKGYSAALCVLRKFYKMNPTLEVGGVPCKDVLNVMGPLGERKAQSTCCEKKLSNPHNWSSSDLQVEFEHLKSYTPLITKDNEKTLDVQRLWDKWFMTWHTDDGVAPSQLVITNKNAKETSKMYTPVGEKGSLSQRNEAKTSKNGMDMDGNSRYDKMDKETRCVSIDKEVFVFGDSHTLTPSWRCLNVNDETWLLRPALATGVKAWHLRPESKFYPRFNFNSVVECIPEKSTVLFLFCEIDCREGLVLATEKDRYATIEDGIAVVVDIYVNTLLDIVKKKRFKALVHPVVPVLDVTRSIVTAFNIILKARLEKVDVKKGIQWVDLGNSLIVPSSSGNVLKDEFKLDGTHLSPQYLTVLSRGFEKMNI